MGLAILSDEIDRDFPMAVEVGLSVGIRHWEVRSTASGRLPNVPDEEIEAIASLCKARGVTVTGLSLGFLKVTLDDTKWEPQLEREFEPAFQLAEGVIDYEGQLKALAADGCDGVLTLENHTKEPPGITGRDVAFVRWALAGEPLE